MTIRSTGTDDGLGRTLLVTAAGGGASNNLIRTLRSRRPRARIVGCNIDPWYLAIAETDARYLVPRASEGAPYIDAVKRIVEKESVDLVIVGNDAEVGPIAAVRNELGARTLLPADGAIALAQDKQQLSQHLAVHGVPTPRSLGLGGVDDVDRIFSELGWPERLWCRLRRGSGSRGALPVGNPEHAKSWVRYWQDMRGAQASDFHLCEYLPGRDFAFQSLWHDGDLVIAKTCERLEYLVGQWLPSGQSSSPRVGMLLNDERVNDVCVRAVRAVDPLASGMFCIDLKENAAGQPCVTEINIGRFFMISPVFSGAGKHDMVDLYVRLAFGEAVDVPPSDRFDDIGKEETFLLRELDALPVVRTRGEIDGGYSRLDG